MGEAERLRQTATRFSSEVERVLDGTFVNMPVPLMRLLDAIDSEPILASHIQKCAGALADGFDAQAEVERVRTVTEATFGPFPVDDAAATAMAYLIVQELAAQQVKFRDPVFEGYGDATQGLAGRARGFEQDVTERLVALMETHLQDCADEVGIELAAQECEQASSGEAEDAPIGIEGILRALGEAVTDLPADEREDVEMQVEALADELASPNPKRSVVRVLMRGIRVAPGTRRFAEAREQLADWLEEQGLA